MSRREGGEVSSREALGRTHVGSGPILPGDAGQLVFSSLGLYILSAPGQKPVAHARARTLTHTHTCTHTHAHTRTQGSVAYLCEMPRPPANFPRKQSPTQDSHLLSG